MPRTAITVTSVTNYQAGTALTGTAGDAANDHQVDLTYAPKLILLVENTGANSINFTVEFPAGKSSYNATISRSHTVGNDELRCIPLDVPPDLAQSGNLLHIDSADANFGDLKFYCFTWADTPIR